MEESIYSEALNLYYQGIKEKRHIVTLFMMTHKRPQYLKLAIDSALNQTYRDFYLIILDNMSGDETASVVKSFKDSRVIYIEHDGNLTVSNYAYAFQLVRTKYVVILHDDDVLENNYLNAVIREMQRHPDLTALSPTLNTIDSYGKLVKKGNRYEGLKYYEKNEYFESFFKGQLACGMVFPAVIYNTKLFGNVYDYLDKRTGPAGDQFIWFEIGRRGGKIAILGQPLINYRIHPNQDSSVNAGTLLFNLLNYLFSVSYYAKILENIVSYLYLVIRASLLSSLHNYKRGVYSRKDLSKIYEMIPKELQKDKQCKIYIYLFKFATVFPICSLLLLKLKRIIKSARK